MTNDWLCEGYRKTSHKCCTYKGKHLHNGHWYCGKHIPLEECSICYEYIKKTQESQLNCQHKYHEECISKWIRKGYFTCPLCRKPLPESMELRWYDLEEVIFPENFHILPRNHNQLYSMDIITFSNDCSMSYNMFMILNYEQPNLFYEYTNLVRYWIHQNTTIQKSAITENMARKFEPFAKKYYLHDFMKLCFDVQLIY
jgi:hypothetical protein